MARLGRLGAVILLSSLALFGVGGSALADHCEPIDNPDPIPGQNTTYCHTPKPEKTPKPTEEPDETPAATAKATTAPATSRPIAPAATRRPVTNTSPTQTPFDIDGVEVPEENALETPQIVVEGPLDDEEQFDVAEPTAGVSSWIFGFIFGFIVGGLVGRASWGLRRRRRQQIFG
jgi:hypothetical protein